MTKNRNNTKQQDAASQAACECMRMIDDLRRLEDDIEREATGRPRGVSWREEKEAASKPYSWREKTLDVVLAILDETEAWRVIGEAIRSLLRGDVDPLTVLTRVETIRADRSKAKAKAQAEPKRARRSASKPKAAKKKAAKKASKAKRSTWSPKRHITRTARPKKKTTAKKSAARRDLVSVAAELLAKPNAPTNTGELRRALGTSTRSIGTVIKRLEADGKLPVTFVI